MKPYARIWLAVLTRCCVRRKKDCNKLPKETEFVTQGSDTSHYGYALKRTIMPTSWMGEHMPIKHASYRDD